MSQGGVTPAYPPTAWVYLPETNCTIRWQRGDDVAYVFEGEQFETYPDERQRITPIGEIPVSPKGWRDIPHVRSTGERWVRAKHVSCPMCGSKR